MNKPFSRIAIERLGVLYCLNRLAFLLQLLETEDESNKQAVNLEIAQQRNELDEIIFNNSAPVQ